MWKRMLIPHTPYGGKRGIFGPRAIRWACVRLACWWGNGLPRRRSIAGLRGRSATLGLRHGPDSYGRQQWGILDNGRKPDPAIPRVWRRPEGCKALSIGRKTAGLIALLLTLPLEEAPANSVPAAAVIRRVRALIGITGRKAYVGGYLSQMWKPRAQPGNCIWNWITRVW